MSQEDLYKKKRDSLLNLLKQNHHDTTKAKLIYMFGYYLGQDGYSDSSLFYTFRALDLGTQNNFEKVIVKANTELAFFYFDQGNLDSSQKYFLRSLAAIKNDSPENYDVYNGIGTLYFYRGDHVKSYEYFLHSLKLAEKSGNAAMISKSYGNVGVSLKEQMKLDDALVFFQKSLEISKKNNLNGMTYVALTNAGNIYSEKFDRNKSRYDATKALEFYEEAKKIVMLKLDDEEDRSNAITLIGNIANVYADLGDYKKAKEIFSPAITMMHEKTFHGSKSMIYNNFSTVLIALEEMAEARKYLEMAKKEAVESGSPSDLMENYKSFSLFYEVKKDFKNAFYSHWNYKRLSDSLFSTEVAEKRKEIELNAEFSRKEAEAKAIQDKKEALAKEEEKKQRIILYAFISGFVLMILVAFQFYRSYRIKQKNNEIITRQKAEVEKQKELVELKQKEILDSIQYAKRIQKAHLPTGEYLEKSLSRLRRDNSYL